jgi:hypothetical protein
MCGRDHTIREAGDCPITHDDAPPWTALVCDPAPSSAVAFDPPAAEIQSDEIGRHHEAVADGGEIPCHQVGAGLVDGGALANRLRTGQRRSRREHDNARDGADEGQRRA